MVQCSRVMESKAEPWWSLVESSRVGVSGGGAPTLLRTS